MGILVLAGVTGGAYFFGKSQSPKPQPPSPVFVSPTPQATPVSSSIPDASPAPTGAGETANWKTYTNTKYGFSLKYPDNLKIIEDSSSESSFSIVFDSIGQTGITVMGKDYDKQPYVGISRVEYEGALKNTLLNQPYQDLQTKRKFIKTGEYIIDGKKFAILKVQLVSDVIDSRLPEQYGTEIMGIVGDNLYRFYPVDNPQFNQILSTFKFTQ